LAHGKLRHSGENFNALREKSLDSLREFIPQGIRTGSSVSDKSGVIGMFRSQMAYVWNSFKPTSGHVSAGGLAYIRIPKAASTSAGMMMLEKLYPALAGRSISEQQVNFLMDVNLIQAVEFDPSIYFTIVRNPFARLVSVYRDFFENTSHYIYSNYLFGILDRKISFAEFVNRISAIPHRLMDQHIKPQHYFLTYYEKNTTSVSVFKLEEPEHLNQFLTRHDLQLPHLNKTSQADFSQYYTLQIFEKVYAIYRKDFEKFNYQNEAESLKLSLKTVHK
jgi:hypothetical protein